MEIIFVGFGNRICKLCVRLGLKCRVHSHSAGAGPVPGGLLPKAAKKTRHNRQDFGGWAIWRALAAPTAKAAQRIAVILLKYLLIGLSVLPYKSAFRAFIRPSAENLSPLSRGGMCKTNDGTCPTYGVFSPKIQRPLFQSAHVCIAGQ
jgi:hypothetical protein